MKSRGFDFEADSSWSDHSENKLFAATTLNITTALADELASAGFGKLQVDDLFKAAIFKIVPLEVERLVQRRIGVARN